MSVDLYTRPDDLLQHLIRFESTNPPGKEGDCIHFIDDLLHEAGIETTILAKDPNRPNIIARLKGNGNAAPLLLYGHVDVVPVTGQRWTHPPFSAEIHDGYIWGRGTLDMKGAVTMMLCAFIQAHVEQWALPGDVILCIVSDEEVGGIYGARFLVEEHAHLFDGVRYALGEFGGFTSFLGGKRFYPIMVTEKQCCGIRATLRGASGHGSNPIRGGAMAKAARMLAALDQKHLPVHITEPIKLMIDAYSAALADTVGPFLQLLLDPAQTDAIIEGMGDQGRVFYPLLHNTVSPNIIRGGDAMNVIPPEVTVDFDVRILPGLTLEDFMEELRTLVGDEPELEITYFDAGSSRVDMGMFDLLGTILCEANPEAIPTPLVLPAVTDGRFFARLGIQTYGFTPMQLAEDFNFGDTIHAADERIPVGAVGFGARMIGEVLRRFS